MKCSNDTVSIITIMRFFFIMDRPVQVRGQCQNNACLTKLFVIFISEEPVKTVFGMNVVDC